MLISLDTETTGLDVHHGCRPFFVTVCQEDGRQDYWEWDVNPLTREVLIPETDGNDVAIAVMTADEVVGQNVKFDAAMLRAAGVVENWPWERTHDTLIAGHLLASNRPHNLTAMVLQYLEHDIGPAEAALGEAVKKCRRMVQQARLKLKRGKEDTAIAHWAICEAGMEGAPSAKGEAVWNGDYWLPRAMVGHLWETTEDPQYCPDNPPGSLHPWWTVLRDYSNTDSAATLALWRVMASHIRARKLWAIYEERRKIPAVVFEMEDRGVTVSGARLEELTSEYEASVERLGDTCVSIAASLGHELSLPKSGRNASLDSFLLDVLKVEPIYSEKARTDKPTLDKAALEYYEHTLPERSKAQAFVKSLRAKRRRDTALTYMESYRRFWLPYLDKKRKLELCFGAPGLLFDHFKDWYVLHPSLNPTATDTLRFSSQNPNEQNISKQEALCPRCDGKEPDRTSCPHCRGTGYEFRSLRYCFGPVPGREWWSMDAKNLELRLPAYESGEPEMIALFERPDDPPYYGSNHLLNFHTVYPDVWDKEQREVGHDKVGPHCKKKYASSNYQWCKNGGFAKQYGGQRRKVDSTFHREGASDLLDSKFARLAALNRKWILFAEKHSYVETIPDYTVDPNRGYPLLCTRTEYGKIKPTVPLNYHVQGSAMWWMCKAMVRVRNFYAHLNSGGEFLGRRWPGGYYLVMQVHDELVSDMPSGAPWVGRKIKGWDGAALVNPWDYNLPVAREVQRLMEMGGDDFGGIPTPVGCEYHAETWAEGITL